MEEAGEQEARGRTEKVCGREGTRDESEVTLNGQAGGASQAVEADGHQRINGDRRQYRLRSIIFVIPWNKTA